MKRLLTSRLTLRSFKPSDMEGLFRVFGDPDVMKYLLNGRKLVWSEAEAFIEENFMPESEAFGMATLCENAGGRVIGLAGLIPCRYLNATDYELGFALAREAWGKGYATEIGLRQIRYALDELNCSRILALVHPENRASRRVIQKLGMHFVKLVETRERGQRQIYFIE